MIDSNTKQSKTINNETQKEINEEENFVKRMEEIRNEEKREYESNLSREIQEIKEVTNIVEENLKDTASTKENIEIDNAEEKEEKNEEKNEEKSLEEVKSHKEANEKKENNEKEKTLEEDTLEEEDPLEEEKKMKMNTSISIIKNPILDDLDTTKIEEFTTTTPTTTENENERSMNHSSIIEENLNISTRSTIETTEEIPRNESTQSFGGLSTASESEIDESTRKQLEFEQDEALKSTPSKSTTSSFSVKQNQPIFHISKILIFLTQAPKIKRNFGFQFPFDPLQYFALLGQILLILEIAIVSVPLLVKDFIIISIEVILTLLIMILTWTVLKLGFFDPVDPTIKNEKIQANGGTEGSGRYYGRKNRIKYCLFCKRFVDSTSKHCKLCDKCVKGFDHHCRWLNTCIGETNYKDFFIFLSTIFILLMLSHLIKILGCFLVPIFWNDYLDLSNRLYWGIIPFYIHIPFSFLCLILEIIVTYFVFTLYVFHLKIKFKGLTTYQEIINKRAIADDQELKYPPKRQLTIHGICHATTFCCSKEACSCCCHSDHNDGESDQYPRKRKGKKLSIFRIHKIVPLSVMQKMEKEYELTEIQNQTIVENNKKEIKEIEE